MLELVRENKLTYNSSQHNGLLPIDPGLNSGTGEHYRISTLTKMQVGIHPNPFMQGEKKNRQANIYKKNNNKKSETELTASILKKMEFYRKTRISPHNIAQKK